MSYRIVDISGEWTDRQTGARAIMAELSADTASDLPSNTADLQYVLGSWSRIVDTGDIYRINSSGVWVLQPSTTVWQNVYTKAEINEMITEIYGIIAYYHTVIVSDTGEITFYALAGYIGTWKIYGNGQQTGTPKPDNPIQPEFVGVRTGNLFSADNTSVTVGAVTVKNENGHITIAGKTTAEIYGSNVAWKNAFSFILKAGTYFLTGANSGGVSTTIRTYSDNTTLAGNNQSFTLVEDTRVFLGFYIYYNTNNNFKIMLNAGSTALPYEPFGWKIPITCGGETNNVYLSAPLRKAIDGTDAVDTLDSAGTLTRNVDENGDALVTPTTETIGVPEIPTVQGENTLTVDTDLKPSKIVISGESN